MSKNIKLLLLPTALLFFILGFIFSPRFIYWGIALLLIVLSFFIYSGRKARVRYWFQGYRRYLLKFDGDEKKATAALLEDFRTTKYGDDLDVSEYFEVEYLIEEIISREFKFNNYRSHSSPQKYHKLVTLLKKEIRDIKSEVLGG